MSCIGNCEVSFCTKRSICAARGQRFEAISPLPYLSLLPYVSITNNRTRANT